MVTQTVGTGDLAHNTSMKILVIEDDREAADYLEKAFAEAGHNAHLARDGETGYTLARNGDYDVLVVDRMLPQRDGLSVIAGLRAHGNDTPVLILSALGEVDDRVTGLRAGGDDYLTKPYAFSELLARVALLDPFGLSAFFEQTHYLPPTERSGYVLQMSGHMLQNRLMVLGLGALCAAPLLWLDERIALDAKGFVVSGEDDRAALETSCSAVFAAGDVRCGLFKRAAAGVGEDAAAVE